MEKAPLHRKLSITPDAQQRVYGVGDLKNLLVLTTNINAILTSAGCLPTQACASAHPCVPQAPAGVKFSL